MARPVHADAAATRARVLAVAASLFAARGPDGVSTREVARGAGVTQATVMHHFGTKEGLHAACVDAMYAELTTLTAELAPLATSGREPPALVAAAVTRAYRFGLAHRAAVRLAMRAVLDRGVLAATGRPDVLAGFLDAGGGLLAALTGRAGDPAALRLDLARVASLVVRFVLLDPADLSALTDAEGEAAVAAAEAHLVRAATRLLLS
jgi:AcrR family transcriptional regulator